MHLPLTHYEQLITEELAGIISPADQAALEEAKATYPEVNELWEKRRAIFTEEIQKWLEMEMTPPPVSTRPVFRRRKRILMVAAITCPILTLLYFLGPSRKPVPLTATMLELRLDNGKVFDLSRMGKIEGDALSLEVFEKTFTYISATSENATLSVPEGKDYQITLSDGTQVFMNAASTLRFPLSFRETKYRHISISGEAYFKVAPDPSRPFTVMLPEGTVQVLGTEFNVKNYDKDKAQVALVSGKVRLQAGNQSNELRPGLAGTLSHNRIDTSTFDVDEMLSWRNGIYIYKRQTMKQVFKVFARWTGLKVEFKGPLPENKLINGEFNKNNPEQFFKSLQEQGIVCSVEGKVVKVQLVAAAT